MLQLAPSLHYKSSSQKSLPNSAATSTDNSVSDYTKNHECQVFFIKCHFVNHLSRGVMQAISSLNIENPIKGNATYVLINRSEELYQPVTTR